jgi:ribose transport system permease protein
VVVLLGGIDLSISGFIVASALTVTTVKDKYHLSFPVALLFAILAAGILGALTGYVCHRFRIQPLVITLAVGAIGVGVIQVQTGGAIQGSAPEWLAELTSPATKTFGVNVPPLVVIWALVTVIMSLFLHGSVLGRRLLATGANPRAAEYSLVKTRRVWTATFAFSAVVAVLVGLLVGGFAGAVDGRVGDPYVFQSVIAVIVGGTVFGGPGDYARTVVGALFVTVVTTVLVGHGADQADQQIIFGLTILLAVALYGRERGFRDRI